VKLICARGARGLLAIGLLLASGFAGAATTLRAPADLRSQVGFDQELGAQLPLGTQLRDANGASVRLRDVLNGKAALLVPGYYGCVNLCSVVRAGVAHAAARSGLRAGSDFEVILLSVDPHEGPADASTAQHNDAAQHPGADIIRWHYLTGTPAASAAIMRSIGFRYFFDTRNGQYDHDVGVVLLTPRGSVTQYLFGAQFEPRTLRLALVNASQGRIGNLVDHFLLMCCDYDPATGRYSMVIRRVMQALGIATALALAGLILLLRRSEVNRIKGATQP
jgi:protein SCO1/2